MAAIMVVASAQNTRLVQSQGEGPCILLYPSGDNDFVYYPNPNPPGEMRQRVQRDYLTPTREGGLQLGSQTSRTRGVSLEVFNQGRRPPTWEGGLQLGSQTSRTRGVSLEEQFIELCKTLYCMFSEDTCEQQLYHSIATVASLLLRIGEVAKRFNNHIPEPPAQSPTGRKPDAHWSISFEQVLASLLTETPLVDFFERKALLRDKMAAAPRSRRESESEAHK
uniref:Uncharacterized protein n=1 Tax=Knipowitschia caucasica TaxID=637954 RepID=A0AAV2M3P2_KNICA